MGRYRSMEERIKSISEKIRELIPLFLSGEDIDEALSVLMNILWGLTPELTETVRETLEEYASDEIISAKWNNGTNYVESVAMIPKRIYVAILKLIGDSDLEGKELADEAVRVFVTMLQNSLASIVETETTRVTAMEELVEAKEEGKTRYEYETAGDEHVCGICQTLEGETFDIESAMPGVNFPPMHPNCRCSIRFI